MGFCCHNRKLDTTCVRSGSYNTLETALLPILCPFSKCIFHVGFDIRDPERCTVLSPIAAESRFPSFRRPRQDLRIVAPSNSGFENYEWGRHPVIYSLPGDVHNVSRVSIDASYYGSHAQGEQNSSQFGS